MDSDAIDIVTDNTSVPPSKSLKAVKKIKKGDFICDLWGNVNPIDRHTVQVSKDKHIMPEGKVKFTNHACSPTAEFEFKARDGVVAPEGKELSWHLVATRDINKGEEITFNYTLTEYEMDAPFECQCGAKQCLGRVQGFKHLTTEQQQEIMAKVSPAIKEIIKN
ncbi:predicted protein [Nematostella vectensis]|uniref:SET domain-containing protein n=1 Tax=Nematostella vectensis TaxID=45351 RepID=A7T2D6_NEMVE|nr:methyltransferase flvH [Nematostella vectensis]EDO29878.1 predicted protein [Nematostella vectensis]|eukprot:XP_001621978.1 hypothetical protein NEMVEDRAFT_v1g248598 [Nematostella vectensis]